MNKDPIYDFEAPKLSACPLSFLVANLLKKRRREIIGWVEIKVKFLWFFKRRKRIPIYEDEKFEVYEDKFLIDPRRITATECSVEGLNKEFVQRVEGKLKKAKGFTEKDLDEFAEKIFKEGE